MYMATFKLAQNIFSFLVKDHEAATSTCYFLVVKQSHI